jgi:ribosomal protein S18 acetylase RimI-like enzyme
MRLRDYAEPDIPSILSVIKQAFAEYKGRLDPPSSAERKIIDIVKTELKTANALVVEIEGTIVGCVFFQPKGNGIYIDRLAVLPKHRNRGLATAMLKEIERRAKSRGYTSLLLSVRLALEKQQAYYEKYGFEFEAYGAHEGYAQPTYMKMKKELDVE